MDELTTEQLEELNSDLSMLQQELETVVSDSEDSDAPVELDQQVMGRVSRVDAIQQQQMLAANRRSAKVRLQRVHQAIASIRHGEYGYCHECEEPIGFARLKAHPETQLCLSCQHAREAKRH